MVRAWRAGLRDDRYKLDGIELEVHREMDKQRQANGLQPSKGIMIPLDLPVDREAARRFSLQRRFRRLPATCIKLRWV
jgi:hypothetical protein